MTEAIFDQKQYDLRKIIEDKNYLNIRKRVEIKVIYLLITYLKEKDMSDDLFQVCIDAITLNVDKYLTGTEQQLDVCNKFVIILK